MTSMFEVLRAGFLSTIQDLGRLRGLAHGFSAAGAMDVFALQVANLLAGNARGDAALESGLGGLLLRALDDRIVAVCGAGGAWKSLRIRKGERLELPSSSSGVWSYLAVDGGFGADEFLGSRSTDLRARRGGFEGRALRAGDVLRVGASKGSAREGRGLAHSERPSYPAELTARVVPGPQDGMFSEEARRAFLSESWELSSQSDRMGYQLRGPALGFRGEADILSEAVVFGSVQVPAGGQPIVLMADRQATGGYAKIATVITADLGKVAQLRPGGRIRFHAVTVEEAQESASRLERFLSTLEEGTR